MNTWTFAVRLRWAIAGVLAPFTAEPLGFTYQASTAALRLPIVIDQAH